MSLPLDDISPNTGNAGINLARPLRLPLTLAPDTVSACHILSRATASEKTGSTRDLTGGGMWVLVVVGGLGDGDRMGGGDGKRERDWSGCHRLGAIMTSAIINCVGNETKP